MCGRRESLAPEVCVSRAGVEVWFVGLVVGVVLGWVWGGVGGDGGRSLWKAYRRRWSGGGLWPFRGVGWRVGGPGLVLVSEVVVECARESVAGVWMMQVMGSFILGSPERCCTR